MAAKSNYFKKYNHIDNFVYLFNDNANKYLINVSGVIIDLNGITLPYIKDKQGENWVYLKIKSIGNVEKEYRVSHLVQHTFKPTSLYLDQYEQVNVLYIDNDYDNLHASNLVWQWTRLMDPLRPGFAIIPGASKYCISKDDVVILRTKNKVIKTGVFEGYVCCKIEPDVGDRFKARVHRLKCLAWLEYPANVDSLDINHKDCIKINNVLSNLEWVTSKENSVHAIINGLQIQSIPVIVRHCFIDRYSGQKRFELEKFISKADCGRRFMVDEVSIGRRIRNNPDLLYIDLANDRNSIDTIHGVQFKEDDDSITWPELIENDDPYLNSQILAKVKVRDILTNKVTIFKDLYSAANFININKQTLYYHLSRKRSYPIDNFDVKLIHDTSNWLHFNKEQIIIIKMLRDSPYRKYSGFSFKITNTLTNEVKYFIGSKELSSFLDIGISEINFNARNNRPVKNWLIKQISLDGTRDLEPLLQLST